MIRIGLSSTALLTKSPREIIALAVESGIEAIEWAGDLHVPHDKPDAALGVMMDTLRAGLTNASYLTLYRATGDGESGLRFESLLHAAATLQAPLLRIFLGTGAEKTPQARAKLVEETRRLGDLSGARGLTLCLSFGRNTILASYPDTLAIMKEIDHPFVRLAWESLPGVRPEEADDALAAAGPTVAMLVARRLDGSGRVGRLAEEAELWRRRLRIFKKAELDPKMGQFLMIGALSNRHTEDVAFLRGLILEMERDSPK